jgi:hypothetical protein
MTKSKMGLALTIVGVLASASAEARVEVLTGLRSAGTRLELLQSPACNRYLNIQTEQEQVGEYSVTTQGYPDCSRWVMSIVGFSLATVQFTSPSEKSAARKALFDYMARSGGSDAQRAAREQQEERKQAGSNPLANWALDMQQEKPDSETAYERAKAMLPALQKNCPDAIVVRAVPVEPRYETTGMESVEVMSGQCHIKARHTINTGEISATQDDAEIERDIRSCDAGIYYGRLQCWNGTSESIPTPLGMR